jgi:hypothetical protein
MRAISGVVASALRRVDPRSERGWSLQELLIACLLSALVLGTANSLVSAVGSQHGRIERQVTAQDRAREAIDGLATQLRNAVGPPGGSTIYYPATGSSAATTELVFYTPNGTYDGATNPRGLQWRRYCLDYSNVANETLWTQTAVYTSAQPAPPSTTTCPSAAWATSRKVATNLVNKSQTPQVNLFKPGLDSGGVVRDMQVALVVQGDSLRKPTPVRSSIDFRNSKSGPSAVVTCQVQNKHAVCDASTSSDPDGEAIGFNWGRTCCSPSYTTSDTRWETGQVSYLYDSGQLSSGTYAIYVKVTDASGLTNTSSTTVVIP